MYILGISAYYHDSSAVLLKDGKILSAFEEERFTRVKHDNSFPFLAIEQCLEINNLQISDIDYIVYYEKPLLKFERIIETFVETYPFSVKPFIKAIPEWFGDKIKIEEIIKKKLKYDGKIYFIPHHLSHAASTFYPSPFEKAAILTIDGVGEYQTTGLWLGEKNSIKPLAEINFPHSFGLLYSTFTAFLGLQVNNDEWKMMGLSAYGKPTYKDLVYKLIDIKKDGSFRLTMKYFSYRESFQMWTKEFENLFGKPKKKGTEFTQRHKDIAASIQKVTEEIYIKILNHLYELTKTANLCISGGVALNSLANGLIYPQTLFKNVYIFGPAGDSAAAVGAALYTYHAILKKKQRIEIRNLNFGTKYSNEQIEEILQKHSLKYEKLNEQKLIKKTAELLSKNNIIGWFQENMEFGPRALGNRSLLANPAPKSMKERVNEVKMREQFRPFAGSVLQDKVQELFEVPEKNHHSPFMNFVFQVKPEARKKIQAIVHADNTCRIQTVNKRDNPLYYELIHRFYELTGIPCVLNTSLNTKIEPIVENPEQAIYDLETTNMDYMVLGNFLVKKPSGKG
ncbi:MAG TPA: carbamoyltransferase N-terminal domain-containing protein [Candidatus Woesebacteria bacterium]|nr:carbamoyltransferase N-terminal domain-containing protein [Candidatus Woesebacteria bacterium]